MEHKVKWKMHEMIWITLVTIIAIARCCWDWITLTPQHMDSVYLIVYNSNNTSFTSYFINVWLPQISSILIFYLSYLAINLSIIPSVKGIFSKNTTGRIINKIIWPAVQLILSICLILLGTNLATWLAHPILFNEGFGPSALFGYSDRPLMYVFSGFPKTMGLIVFISLLALAREIILRYFERPGSGKAYWILIINQLTAFAMIYFLIIYVLSALKFENVYFHVFISVVPPVLLAFMSNIYWLFPWKGNLPVLSYRVLLRLLLSTFICTFPFFAIKDTDLPHDQFILFLYCWVGQLFITTPISWLVYRQRKEMILHFRDMEKELAKNRADLQLLRSQINPHFLFNVLNSLYGLALREKSMDTAKGIQMLGDMMRFMLHENTHDLIPLSKEIEYLKNYIVLQKLRTQASPDIIIDEKIIRTHCDHLIAPMLLIPFIENAFKHGISLQDPSWIKISLQCDENNICFEVRNSLHPKAGSGHDKDSSGIGLKNVRERLNLIYPQRHHIDIGVHDGEFRARLIIQP